MDSKLYFVSSLVAFELIRLFRPADPDAKYHRKQPQQVSAVTAPTTAKCMTDEETAVAEEKQVSELVKALRVVPHPEGGYFRETYRSGAEPMASKGKTDEGGDLISTNTSRPVHGTHSSSSIGSSDSDDSTTCLRNQMTSMVFMATRDAPILYFGINKSDHVHYFHGPPGSSYTYVVVYPSGEVKELTLGCDVQNNESLQIVFPRGCFKAGHLNGPYCLIGEGVAPGFDFRDFTFCDEDMLQQRLAGASSDQQQSAGDRGSGSGQHVEYLMKKYVKYVKPDRRRNFDDYYGKNKLEVGK